MDQITLMTISANNLFMAKDQGKALTESEYLYMQSCMDYLREVHRAKTIELRLHLERFENERLKQEYPENQPKTDGDATPGPEEEDKSKETDEDGHQQGTEGDRV